MADYSLSDFLQGRNPWAPRTLQEVHTEMQRNGEIDAPAFGGAMPQSWAQMPYASVLPPAATYIAGQSFARGGEPRQTALWRSLPPTGPQPPSRLRTGW